jgi:hypothetical protein
MSEISLGTCDTYDSGFPFHTMQQDYKNGSSIKSGLNKEEVTECGADSDVHMASLTVTADYCIL